MKILKKALSAVVAASLLASVFTGCGGGTSGSSAAAGGASGAKGAESASADDGGKEIVLWTNGTENPDKLLWATAVDKFNQENKDGWHVTVVATQNDNYKQKLTVAMSSGECPDVYKHWTGGPMIEYIKAGYAQPITDLMDADGFKDRFMDAAIAQATYQDDIYALPVLNCSVAGFFYNKDLFAKYSLQAPKTVAELEKVCDTFVKNGVTPFALANATCWTGSMYYMYLAARKGGLEPFSKAVDGSGSFEDECFQYAGQTIEDWVDKGYFPQGVNGLDEDSGQSRQMMYKEQAAMDLMGSWRIGNYQADSPEFYKKVGWFPFPTIDGSSADSSILVGTIGDGFLSFNCKGDKLKAAFECMKYYSSDEDIKVFTENGKLPPLKGIKPADAVWTQISDAIEHAGAVQLWYDQYLPPEVSEVHKSESQKLFDKSATPEAVNKAQQEAMQKYLANQK